MTRSSKSRQVDYGARVFDPDAGQSGYVEGFRGNEVLLRPISDERSPCGCPTWNAVTAKVTVERAAPPVEYLVNPNSRSPYLS
ncbi:hypothetical protein ABIA38_004122 [Embleya sp. AB8]